MERLRLLFVCSRNQWRSPTGEQLWRKRPGIEARSAGTSPSARHPVSLRDLEWADVVLVMEASHKKRLVAAFREALAGKPLHVLDIPDEHGYMAPELVELLDEPVARLIGYGP